MPQVVFEEELARLGLAIYRQEVGFGTGQAPRSELVQLGIRKLRDAVCPHKEKLTDITTSHEAQLATLIADVIASYAIKSPFVAATASRLIIKIGVNRFCTEPASILAAESDSGLDGG